MATSGPVCILAGAGTGKTRTITHRIAYGVLSGAMAPGQVLAVTFTARAAGELRGRLRGLGVDQTGGGVQARTFHAAALRQLSYFWPRTIGGAMPPLAEHKIRLVGEAASKLRLQLAGTGLRDATAELEWAKSCLVAPEGYVAAAAAAGRFAPIPPESVAKLYAAYEETKTRRGVLDFDDLLMLTAAVIEEHADVAEELHSRYRHFVVDEYQDVNPLQQRLLDAWLGGRDDLCVVGDANQTIYSFTGANPQYLLDFSRRYPDATVVRLVRDYRSTPQVVELANKVIAGARGLPTGARLTLQAQLPDGPEPSFTEHDAEPREAADVAKRIKVLLGSGVATSQVAVLYRINAQSEAYEQALAAAGIPYVLRGGAKFFDRAEIREAVMLLRGAARGSSEDAPSGLLEAVYEVLAAAKWRPDAPPDGGGAERERWDNLNALVGVAAELAEAEPLAGLAELVTELEERSNAQHAPAVEGVTLASLHTAKGLEWDAVFLVGLVEGTLPIVHAATPAAREEERRLLYVGVTRAKRHLALSWAGARADGGRRTRKRSSFLDGIAPDLAVPAGKAAGRSKGAKAAARSALSPGDQQAFDALKAWRAATAAEEKMPAFVVLSDATLAAIAVARPATRAQLFAVPGIGQAKWEKYGPALLDLCAALPPA